MSTVNLTTESFQETIERDGIVLVDFWASWCGPCRVFGPIFEQASTEHPDMTFAKVDTEAQPEIAGALNIRSIPTLMVFRDRVLLYSQPGALPKHALDDLIAQAEALDMEAVRRELEERKAAASA